MELKPVASDIDVECFTNDITFENLKLKKQLKLMEEENLVLIHKAKHAKLKLVNVTDELADLENEYEEINSVVVEAKRKSEMLRIQNQGLNNQVELAAAKLHELEIKANAEHKLINDQVVERKLKTEELSQELQEKTKQVELLSKHCNKSEVKQFVKNLKKTEIEFEYLKKYFEDLRKLAYND